MKKFLLITIVLFLVGGFLFAQERAVGASPGIGLDEAQKQLTEISVDKFEHDGFWRSTMSADEGYTTSRLFPGGPNPERKGVIPGEENLNIPDDFVLGTRVDFLRRGYSSFFILPARPIPIEGITQYITMWVAGRNFNHNLYVLIQDFFGRNYQFLMTQDGGAGSLNFNGWQKLYAYIPTTPEDGISGVVQRSYHYNNNFGIKIMGFRIDCDPMQARGSYYIYFDDLRAFTNLFEEFYRDDPDDMSDGW